MGFSEHTKPPLTVQAEQIEGEPRSVITPNGPVTAQPGDWEVRFPDGNVQAMSDEEFQGEFGEGGSEDSGNRPSAPALADDGDADKDRVAESASAVEDNTGSRKSATVDSEAEDESAGDEAEEKTETPEPSPPPIRRRR